jgi:enediyne biosynthesis protein E4
MRFPIHVFLALLLCGSTAAQPGPIHFHEANRELGLPVPTSAVKERKYTVQQIAGGVALLDCDNDGKLDIVTINEPTVESFRRGKGVPMLTLYHQVEALKFEDVTRNAGLLRTGWGMGISVADYDNDGLLDIFVSGYGGNALYHSIGNCKFTDVTEKSGVNRPGYNTGSAWADYDRDGKVDLFVSRYVHTDLNQVDPIRTNYKGLMVEAPWGMTGEGDFLFHNKGDGTFEEVGKKAGVSDPDARIGLSAIWGDLDGDGWPDLYVANDTQPNYYYRNRHDGTFEDIALISGNAVGGDGKALASMGVDIGDYDRDGRFDIAVTTYAYEPIELHHNNGTEGFADTTWTAHTGQGTFRAVKWGIGLRDFDNDGWLDMAIAAGHTYSAIDALPGEPGYREPMILFRNKADGTFEDISKASGLNDGQVQARRGIAFGDIDNDGDIDTVVFNQNNPPSVFLNDAKNLNHRVLFKLEGTKSNRAAIGARLTIRTADGQQLAEVRAGGSHLSQNDLRLHFGLGKTQSMTKVEILWPSGGREEIPNVAADFIYTIVEGKGIKSSVALPALK